MAKNTNKKLKRERKALSYARKEQKRHVYEVEVEDDPSIPFFNLIFNATGGGRPWGGFGILGNNISEHIYHEKYDHYQRRAVNRIIRVFRRWKILEYIPDSTSETLVWGADPDPIPKEINVAVNVAKYKNQWINEPEKWIPPDHMSKNDLLGSLIRFLLVKYDVPEFLDKVWTEETPLISAGRYSFNKKPDPEYKMRQEWYINIGNGENIRNQKGLPIPLTKKMAHNFSLVPPNTEVMQAFRWTQLTSMGIKGNVINGVMSLPLSEKFENDEFWLSVIRFFDNNPFMAAGFYRTIYDYILQKKYTCTPAIQNGERVELTPEQPNFSIKGRNPMTLIEQVSDWHMELNNRTYDRPVRELLVWETCGIQGFSTKYEDKFYAIIEMLGSKELIDDGKEMNHCVATYDRECYNGMTAIYSLQSSSFKDDAYVREVTIEVDLKRKQIIQARKSHNRGLDDDDKEIIKLWAEKVNFEVAKWIF